MRDQLQVIQTTVDGVDEKTITQALNFCVKNRLYSASDFSDAIGYFKQRIVLKDLPVIPDEVKAIDPEFSYKRTIKPVLRSLESYKLQ